jgi:hypothetical protein
MEISSPGSCLYENPSLNDLMRDQNIAFAILPLFLFYISDAEKSGFLTTPLSFSTDPES